MRACHSPDPGVPARGFRGIVRVHGTVGGMTRFVGIAASRYHGLNLCIGSTAEMLQDPHREIHDVIRDFGARQQIFDIHFRHIRGRRAARRPSAPDDSIHTP